MMAYGISTRYSAFIEFFCYADRVSQVERFFMVCNAIVGNAHALPQNH